MIKLIAIWIYGISLMWQSGVVAKWRLSENRAKLACAMPSVSHFDDVRVTK